MNQWILYCLLCSLIYAMSVHAQPVQTFTADVVYWNNAKIPVLDCALLIPQMDKALGNRSTDNLMNALKTKGFSPSIVSSLQIQEFSQADSAGHQVNEFYTYSDSAALNRNGNNTLYLSLTGGRKTLMGKDKKHKFTLRLHTIGRAKEIAKTVQVGTLGQNDLNIKDLPNCQPKDLN